MSTNPEVKRSECWRRERKGNERWKRRKKNRSDDNGERIPLGVREMPARNPISRPLLSLYIRRISTNEIIKITKLSARRTTRMMRTRTRTTMMTKDRGWCAPEPLFPPISPPSLYLRRRLCTHPFAHGETGNGSTGINENSRRKSFEIPLENQRRPSFFPTVVSLAISRVRSSRLFTLSNASIFRIKGANTQMEMNSLVIIFFYN